MSAQWVHYVIKHSFFYMHTILFTEHAIGASDAAVPFDLQGISEGQEGNPEVEVQQVGLEEPEGEEVECPNHEPASFVKDKPRSILSLPLLLKVYLICYIYCCIKFRSCDENLCCTLFHPCPDNSPYLGYRVRIGKLLSHALSGRSRVISRHLRDIGLCRITIVYMCYRGWNLSKLT